MNKRIEQLAEQVDLLGDFVPTKIPGRYAGTISIADIEKFAELIVKECIQLCNNQIGNSDYNTGRMHYREDIMDHFGVEE